MDPPAWLSHHDLEPDLDGSFICPSVTQLSSPRDQFYVARERRDNAIRCQLGSQQPDPYLAFFAIAYPKIEEQQAIACLSRPRDGEDRCVGGEEGTVDRIASGETHRPHHPRCHPGPRPARPHEGLRHRVARQNSGTLECEARQVGRYHVSRAFFADQKIDAYWNNGVVPCVLAEWTQVTLREVD